MLRVQGLKICPENLEFSLDWTTKQHFLDSVRGEKRRFANVTAADLRNYKHEKLQLYEL